jgi:hypothetical protein
MMPNGKILCAFSRLPTSSNHFPSPTYFYEFDYLTNAFTKIHAPAGGDTLHGPCYITNMLNLPDGSILFSTQGSSHYYVYTPSGAPLAAGKPTIDTVMKVDCTTYQAAGKLFNGISEGSCYGDDWQMASNYPIIRLMDEMGSVYYTRTFKWNRTGVMTGSLPDTTLFAIDPAMPEGHYKLQLIVNGIASDTFAFQTCDVSSSPIVTKQENSLRVWPNPASHEINIGFTASSGGNYNVRLIDVMGRTTKAEDFTGTNGATNHTMSLEGVPTGLYTVIVANETELLKTKILVE